LELPYNTLTPMTLDDELTRAVETLGERLRDDLSRELRLLTDQLAEARARDAAAVAEPIAPLEVAQAAAVETAGHTSERAPADRMQRLLDGVRAIDRARTLTGVIDALLDAANGEAPRAAMFLVRDGRVRAHRTAGFPTSISSAAMDSAVADAGVVGVAVERGAVASSPADGPVPGFAQSADLELASLEALALPITLDGEAVAVLYVDRPDAGGAPALDPSLLEVLARHAGRALEALTAFKTARAFVRADTGSMAVAQAVTHGPDEDEAARRYARLVISEIKLYHEDAVSEGQRAGDLATRLGGEIARARALYDQRVPAHLRGASEHFHAELVRTLGNGDDRLFARAGAA
jgi:hypothetical protein